MSWLASSGSSRHPIASWRGSPYFAGRSPPRDRLARSSTIILNPSSSPARLPLPPSDPPSPIPWSSSLRFSRRPESWGENHRQPPRSGADYHFIEPKKGRSEWQVPQTSIPGPRFRDNRRPSDISDRCNCSPLNNAQENGTVLHLGIELRVFSILMT